MPYQSRSQPRQSSGMMRALSRTRICLLLVCCCVAIILWLTFEQGKASRDESAVERWLHAKIIPDTETDDDHHHPHGVLVKQDGEETEEERRRHFLGARQGGIRRGKKPGNFKNKKEKDKSKEVKITDLGMKEQEAEQFIREKIKSEYCNPPTKEITGEEGKFKPGFNLKAAYVITRHGDRTPMYEFTSIPDSNWRPQWNCDLKKALKTVNSDILKQFVDQMQAEMIKGDMTGAVRIFKNLPINNQGICGKSQLTPVGWLQHLELGKYFRKTYSRTLVPNPGLLSNISIFRSTLNTRTQQSAFAFMYGFFEGVTLNDTIRIKTVPNVNFCPLEMCTCPALDKLIKAKETQHSILTLIHTTLAYGV